MIETISGASGSIGTGKLARSAPDGYTIGLGQWDNLVLNGAIYALPYDLKHDFAPIALFASNPQVIVSRKHASGEEPARADSLAASESWKGLTGNSWSW